MRCYDESVCLLAASLVSELISGAPCTCHGNVGKWKRQDVSLSILFLV